MECLVFLLCVSFLLTDVISKPECQALHKYLGELAAKFRAVKFVKIVAQECIKNYPDSATPTVLIYKNVSQ